MEVYDQLLQNGRWSGFQSRAFGWRASLLRLIAAALLLNQCSLSAQQALRNSLTSDAAIAARGVQQEAQPYTFKSGDFRLLLTPSLGLEYNDNVRITSTARQDDFILKPLLDLRASYPLTARNLLRVNLAGGYDVYLNHSQYSTLRLDSGSEIAFDMYAGDFWINLHDRFKYFRDPGAEAAVVSTARYGGLDNTAGANVTWDLRDVVPTLAYDHQNFVASADEFEYLNRASELLLGRVGFQVHPRLVTGIEGTGSFTAYDQHVLNDNTGYGAGVYADWKPGSYFQLRPRAGYTAYLFDQTSRFIKAQDQDAWYADLTVIHHITEAISYSVSVGHELRLGIEADSIEDTYVRSAVTWRILRDLTLNPYLGYENGTQGTRGGVGNFREHYDWFGGGIALSHPIVGNLSASLSYRLTLRSSDLNSRDYHQNLVALRLIYPIK